MSDDTRDIAEELEFHADTCDECSCCVGAPLEREAAGELRKLRAEHDLLRSQFKLAIGRDEQTLSHLLGVAKTESDRLKALALRAWHSYRSGLACQNGLTDDDIETLVKMDAERSENGVPVGGCTPVQSQ